MRWVCAGSFHSLRSVFRPHLSSGHEVSQRGAPTPPVVGRQASDEVVDGLVEDGVVEPQPEALHVLAGVQPAELALVLGDDPVLIEGLRGAVDRQPMHLACVASSLGRGGNRWQP